MNIVYTIGYYRYHVIYHLTIRYSEYILSNFKQNYQRTFIINVIVMPAVVHDRAFLLCEVLGVSD